TGWRSLSLRGIVKCSVSDNRTGVMRQVAVKFCDWRHEKPVAPVGNSGLFVCVVATRAQSGLTGRMVSVVAE
ncbi:MAG: hypothetical protein LAO78_19780, partial [Acidobacteriia bacterium]|nr:hypothetical protein [Terriglobia bacterium]